MVGRFNLYVLIIQWSCVFSFSGRIRKLKEIEQLENKIENTISDLSKMLEIKDPQTSKDKNDNPKISKDQCSAVKSFITKESKITESLIPNDTKICPKQRKTCCTSEDFHHLKEWWEGQSSQSNSEQSNNSKIITIKMSRIEIRQHKQEDLIIYTSKLLSSFEIMKQFALEMANPINKSDDFCLKVSEEFKAYIPDRQVFSKDKYVEYAKKCWDFLNLLQTSIQCSLCDPEAQSGFNFNKGGPNKIYITQEGLNDFNRNCREIFMFNVKILRPYLNLIERLTRCTTKGLKKASLREISGETLTQIDKDSFSSGEYINGLALPWLVDLGTNINVNLEGDYKYLIRLFKRFSNIFPETELLNALDVEKRLDDLGNQMIKIAFTESEINLQLSKEKGRLKEQLKPGESIEAYYYKNKNKKESAKNQVSTNSEQEKPVKGEVDKKTQDVNEKKDQPKTEVAEKKVKKEEIDEDSSQKSDKDNLKESKTSDELEEEKEIQEEKEIEDEEKARRILKNVQKIFQKEKQQLSNTEKNRKLLGGKTSAKILNGFDRVRLDKNEFELKLKEVGDLQIEIARRLDKLMAKRKSRRRLALKLRYELLPELDFELTKDMSDGGMAGIELDLKKITKVNPYHEITSSFAISQKLSAVQSDFMKKAGIVFCLYFLLVFVCMINM